MSSGHSLTFWTFAATLTFNTVIFFSHKTLWLMMMYHQAKLGCQRICRSEDIVKRVIFWSYEPSLWPWPPEYSKQIFSAWHSGLWIWRCVTIPTSLTIQTNIHCHFEPSLEPDLDCIFPLFFTGHSCFWCFPIKLSLAVNGPAVLKNSKNSHILIL